MLLHREHHTLRIWRRYRTLYTSSMARHVLSAMMLESERHKMLVL